MSTSRTLAPTELAYIPLAILIPATLAAGEPAGVLHNLGLYLLTLIACWGSGDASWIGAGLLLVLLAGYMPEATYHHLLLLVGVLFLSGAARWAVPSHERRNGPFPIG